MKFKVLKDSGNHKAGDEVEIEVGPDFTPEQIATLINDGTIEPIFNEADFDDKVLAEEDITPEMAKNGLKVGDTIKVPKGIPVNAVAHTVAAEVAPANVVAAVDPNEEPRKRYRGQIVITDGFRDTDGGKVHHIRIADGSTYDLSDKDYLLEVKLSYPPHK